jgi:hypothetical protein
MTTTQLGLLDIALASEEVSNQRNTCDEQQASAGPVAIEPQQR